jgi:hypothetical protein
VRKLVPGAVLVLFVGVPLPALAAGVPTFSKDVAPILYKSCVECHRPTMFAPMSLTTYDAARPYAQAIKRRVVARQMPPWSADPAIGHFRNDPRLTETEIATIVQWVDGGAPRGNDRDLPALPAFAEGWTIGTPDVVLEAQAYTVPASGTIPYLYFRIPTNFTDDRWLQAIEISPSARAVVHHVIAFAQPSGGDPNNERTPGRMQIGGTTPNKPGLVFDPGVARLLPRNHDLVLQMHYTANGTEMTDRTRVALIFAKEPPKKQAGGSMILNLGFAIPPGADNHEVRASQTMRRDTVLTSMTPHMHMRGRDMTYIAHYPDGRSETLLSVPNYDFNWQHTYVLAEPKVLPAGTKLEVIAHFDNSPNNRFNPDPGQTVRWGDQTWEEMMIGFIGTVQDRAPAAAPSTGAQQ